MRWNKYIKGDDRHVGHVGWLWLEVAIFGISGGQFLGLPS